MQTAVCMFLKEIADDLWHKIKIQAVTFAICRMSDGFSLDLTSFQPQLFPFTGNGTKRCLHR